MNCPLGEFPPDGGNEAKASITILASGRVEPERTVFESVQGSNILLQADLAALSVLEDEGSRICSCESASGGTGNDNLGLLVQDPEALADPLHKVLMESDVEVLDVDKAASVLIGNDHIISERRSYRWILIYMRL